jgi:hypothetical protein
VTRGGPEEQQPDTFRGNISKKILPFAFCVQKTTLQTRVKNASLPSHHFEADKKSKIKFSDGSKKIRGAADIQML